MDFIQELECFIEIMKYFSSIPETIGKPLVRDSFDRMISRVWKPKQATWFFAHKLRQQHMGIRDFGGMRQGMENLGNGILKKTLSEGFGEILQDNKRVSLYYSIFVDGDEGIIGSIDSTYLAQEPFVFVLGKESRILPGFEKAVRTMRNQEKAQFIIPRLFADGANAANPNSLKDSFVEIEIIRVATDVTKAEKSRIATSFNLTLNAVHELRNKAKAAFSSGFYRCAAFDYTSAMLLLMNVMIQNEAENDKRLQLIMKMSLNCGMAFNKFGQHKIASEFLVYAVEMIDGGVNAEDRLKGKIFLHACRSLRLDRKFADATECLKRAHAYLGNIPEVLTEFHELGKFYDVFMDSMSFDKILCKIFKQKIAKNVEEDSPAYQKDKEFFETIFEQMLQTFLCDKAKRREFYVMPGIYNNTWVKNVAAKYEKVNLNVQRNDMEIVRFVLTKK
ncbi:inactive peptidyl-prolyl cis-trans isomerase shutdown-like [Phlebotomus argentipes]|uniref:inactive peptidyl-prolyl cis-trans isomerase shutdown-like n=1 Tax=Phlebotomus argentipes TaxID=94469 RepID=UPI0028930A48|nr:inactive peptidyl-prolyl cis-trans isomerase shutdown-like [Phlebotomus argentipes]